MVSNAFSVVCLKARLTAIIASIFLGTVPQSSAQVTRIEDAENEQPTTFKMTVSAAAEPRPALKYHFLTPPVDQIKGNAATFYYKSMSFEGRDPFNELNKFELDDEKSTLAHDAPLEKFPREDVARLVNWLDGSYGDWLWRAARCDSCDWEDDIRNKGISVMLPQIQKSRGLARALMLRARLQIVDHQYDDAVRTLAISYALAQNLGHGTTLIHSLVGIAISGITGEQTRTLIAAENSPNLYWALTDLAAHPIDLRQALSYESRFWEFTIHELDDLGNRILTPEETMQIVGRLEEVTRVTPSWDIRRDEPDRTAWQLTIMAGTLTLYPQAKAYLLEQGYDPASIEAMPVLQTALLFWWKQFNLVRDNTFKWILLPDRELHLQLDRADNELRDAAGRREGGVFMVMLPAVQAAFHARIRSQRQIDLLRAVEALRMHAAEHGRWPEKLEDVTIVPVPRDPWIEKPFLYSVRDGVAILEMSPTPKPAGGLTVNHRYELTLRKSKQN